MHTEICINVSRGTILPCKLECLAYEEVYTYTIDISNRVELFPQQPSWNILFFAPRFKMVVNNNLTSLQSKVIFYNLHFAYIWGEVEYAWND